MSNGDMTPPPPVSPPRSGCLTALMVIAGIILLLPGLCAAIFGIGALTSKDWPNDVAGFVVLGLLVGALGVAMIWYGIKRPRP
jgi:hypothetical protein